MAKLRLLATVKVAKETTLRPGAVIEVKDPEDEQAASLVARGFARWVKAGDGIEEDGLPLDRIIAAIGQLDPANAKHFRGGKPELKALGELLGVDITADQRDRAWAALQG
ncbi:hypothetical protein [Azospirillum lipoferum]|uniref:Uncharacterized protein n=1 Tax=Azospirillum lipoferum (strain 4B) TaxID=862719 RepID=G7ZBJ3_AZOL4|nr:hypothetical protein [Azospirillum lipoferum]CBS88717.1 protein of unknown function [Azospirillum lipoferum 4B]